jgi:hypothetical protein
MVKQRRARTTGADADTASRSTKTTVAFTTPSNNPMKPSVGPVKIDESGGWRDTVRQRHQLCLNLFPAVRFGLCVCNGFRRQFRQFDPDAVQVGSRLAAACVRGNGLGAPGSARRGPPLAGKYFTASSMLSTRQADSG